MADPLRREITVRCDVHTAFRTFTEGIDGWWPRSHRRFAEGALTLAPGVGGALENHGPDGLSVVLGQVLHWDPPRGLVYTWTPGMPPNLHTTVHVTFEAQGRDTRVTVLHAPDGSDAPHWSRSVHRFEGGWDAVLPAFARSLLNLKGTSP